MGCGLRAALGLGRGLRVQAGLGCMLRAVGWAGLGPAWVVGLWGWAWLSRHGVGAGTGLV